MKTICRSLKHRSWVWPLCSSRLILSAAEFLDDLVQGRGNFRIKRLEIWKWCPWTNCADHVHFFDPRHCSRGRTRTGTYLGLESYVPTRNCCWRREFVTVKLWNLQLGINHMILWIHSFWRRVRISWAVIFANRVSSVNKAKTNWFWRARLHLVTMHCTFLSEMRNHSIGCRHCVGWRKWIVKNVSRFSVLISFFLSQAFLAAQKTKRVLQNCRWTGNVGQSTTACWVYFLEFSWILYKIHSFTAVHWVEP